MTRRSPPLPAVQALALPVLPPRRLTADLRQLLALAQWYGPALLEGQRPGKVGLRLTHPKAPSCPAEHAEAGTVAVEIMPLDELRAAAGSMRLPAGLGQSPVLLVGKKWQSAALVSPRLLSRPRRSA